MHVAYSDLMSGAWRYAVLAACLGLAACASVRQGVAVLTHSPSDAAATAPGGRYTLDPGHASVQFSVMHLGYAFFTGRFDDLSGTLEFRPDDPIQSTLHIRIRTASVNSGKAEVDTLLRDELFEADDHPVIHFASADIALTGETTGTVTGALTMGGQTRPLTLDVTFNGAAPNPLTGDDTLGFSATASLDRSDWGLGDWFPAVAHDVALRIEAEFIRQAD